MQTQSVIVNMIPNQSTPAVVNVSQNDIGRPITFIVMDGKTPADLTDVAATIVGKKRSGLGFSEVGAVNGNKVTLDTTLAMTQEAGEFFGEIRFVKFSENIGTANFILAVEKDPHPSDTTDGTIDDAVTALEQAREAAEEAEESAIKAERAATTAGEAILVVTQASQMTDTSRIYFYGGNETGYTTGHWYYFNGTAWTDGGEYGYEPDVIYPKVFPDQPINHIYMDYSLFDWRARFLSGSNYSTYTSLQGVCYNSNKDRYVLAIADSSTVNAILVEMDSTYTVTAVSSPLPLGHANDLTFNPTTNLIYVSCGSTGDNANKIAIVNASDLTFYRAFTPDVSTYQCGWQIAYDPENDIYYVLDLNKQLHVFDDEWAWIKTITIKYSYTGRGRLVAQGAEVCDGKFCLLLMTKDDSSGGAIVATHLLFYDENGDVSTKLDYANPSPEAEVESAMYIDGVLILVYGQNWLRFCKISLENSVMEDVAQVNSFYGGNLLKEGTNLNDVTVLGRYESINAARSATMTNVPPAVNAGFMLDVSLMVWGYIKQKLVTTAGYSFSRYYHTGNKTWSNWALNYEGGNVGYSTINRFAGAGYITSSGKTINFSIPFHFAANPASVVSGGIVVRQNGNYLLGTGDTSQSLADSSVISSIGLTRSYCNLLISINLVNAPANVVNNHVVGIQISDLVLGW